MGTVWIKQGVKGKLNRQTRKGFGRVAEVYFNLGLDLQVTSLMEGNHSPGSLYYDGGAFDIKRQGVKKALIVTALGKGFDVIEYFGGRDIFHIEYDPKEIR